MLNKSFWWHLQQPLKIWTKSSNFLAKLSSLWHFATAATNLNKSCKMLKKKLVGDICNSRYKFEQNPQNFLAKLSSFWLFQHQLKFEQKLQNDFNFFATFATSATKLNKSCKMLKTFYFAILQHRLWIWTKVAKCSKLMAKLSFFWPFSHLSIVLSKVWLSIVFTKNTSV